MLDTGAIEVLSTCCQAQVQIVGEVVQHYECEDCHHQCQVKVLKPLDYSLFDWDNRG